MTGTDIKTYDLLEGKGQGDVQGLPEAILLRLFVREESDFLGNHRRQKEQHAERSVSVNEQSV